MSKHSTITPVASAARTANSSQTIGDFPGMFDEVVGYLKVTAASGTSPTLDVVYEVSPDGGTTWYTHTSFTQATGVTSERKVFTRPAGAEGRLSWTIGGSDTPTFTFSCWVEGKKEG